MAVFDANITENETVGTQSTYVYVEYHSVCPLVGIGTLPPPLSSECALPPGTGEGAHSPAGLVLGDSGVPIPTPGEKAYHSAYSVCWDFTLVRLSVYNVFLLFRRLQRHFSGWE